MLLQHKVQYSFLIIKKYLFHSGLVGILVKKCVTH